MERTITDEEKDKIINLGALGYSDEECATVLGWDDVNVSGFRELYHQGEIRSRYVVDLKLFELATGGDIRALQELERRKKQKIRDEKKQKR